jgi:hypothetical protein
VKDDRASSSSGESIAKYPSHRVYRKQAPQTVFIPDRMRAVDGCEVIVQIVVVGMNVTLDRVGMAIGVRSCNSDGTIVQAEDLPEFQFSHFVICSGTKR